MPQIIIFCIPIDLEDAQRIKNISDFQLYFSNGLSTKIKNKNNTETVYLEYINTPRTERDINARPKFVANIMKRKVTFNLSPLNFLSNDSQLLSIDHFYSGNRLNDELFNKRLVILEPNWHQLDNLFLEQRVLFTDWK